MMTNSYYSICIISCQVLGECGSSPDALADWVQQHVFSGLRKGLKDLKRS